MKYIWEDLPKPLSCFTVCNTAMFNLNTKKVVQYYSTNTKIEVVQKCVTENGTFYRTDSARHHYLNYAFKATALGLPNEIAPPVPYSKTNSLEKHTLNRIPEVRAHKPVNKIKRNQKGLTPLSPKGGEDKGQRGWLKRIFRRKNG